MRGAISVGGLCGCACKTAWDRYAGGRRGESLDVVCRLAVDPDMSEVNMVCGLRRGGARAWQPWVREPAWLDSSRKVVPIMM